MKSRYNFAILCVLVLMSFAIFEANGQAPEVVLRPSQIPQAVALNIRPNSTGWVMLQASSDLVTWHPVVNLLTAQSSGPFVDYPASNSTVRFYRVVSPGVTATEALSKWQANRPTHYRYSFQNMKLDDGGVLLAGTVTISNGVNQRFADLHF